jgi:hypothetical protein
MHSASKVMATPGIAASAAAGATEHRPTAWHFSAGFLRSIGRAFATAVRLRAEIEPLPPRGQRDAALTWLRDSAQERGPR